MKDFEKDAIWGVAATGALKAFGKKMLTKATPFLNKTLRWYNKQPKWAKFIARTAGDTALYTAFSLPITLANDAIQTGIRKGFEAGMGVDKKIQRLNQLQQGQANKLQLNQNIKQAALEKIAEQILLTEALEKAIEILEHDFEKQAGIGSFFQGLGKKLKGLFTPKPRTKVTDAARTIYQAQQGIKKVDPNFKTTDIRKPIKPTYSKMKITNQTQVKIQPENFGRTQSQWAKWFKNKAKSTLRGAALWSIPGIALGAWSAYSNAKKLSDSLDKQIAELEQEKTAELKAYLREKAFEKMAAKISGKGIGQTAKRIEQTAEQASNGGRFLGRIKNFGKSIGTSVAAMPISQGVDYIMSPITNPIKKANKWIWEKIFRPLSENEYQKYLNQ